MTAFVRILGLFMNRLAFLILLNCIPALATAADASRVEFELILESGLPPTAPQQWMEVLKDLKLRGLRMRQAKSGDQVEVIDEGSERSRSYRVVGALTARNTLLLPGGRSFNISDKRSIATWIEKLPHGGADESAAKQSAFGLSEKQLVAIHGVLGKPITFLTRDRSSNEVITTIVRGLAVPVELDASAKTGVNSQESVLDEFEGLSSGTALAGILRPLGLVLAPEKFNGSEVRLRIAEVRQLSQSWPIGWPIEKTPKESAPDLYKFLNVDITDVPLNEALEAIQKRVQMPFLFDHNSMARHRVDPVKTKVSIPPGKTYYKGILDKILSQGKLRCEIRMDEAEKAFLWVSTQKS